MTRKVTELMGQPLQVDDLRQVMEAGISVAARRVIMDKSMKSGLEQFTGGCQGSGQDAA